VLAATVGKWRASAGAATTAPAERVDTYRATAEKVVVGERGAARGDERLKALLRVGASHDGAAPRPQAPPAARLEGLRCDGQMSRFDGP
jgi:hypothetical protein